MNIRSMTGFARVRRNVADGELTLGVKAVNHRGLDLHFHMSGEFDPFEAALRGAAKKMVTRGHLDIRLHFARAGAEGGPALNTSLFRAYLIAYHQAAQLAGMEEDPNLSNAFRIPGMFEGDRQAELPATMEAELVSMMNEALEELNRFREREGAETCLSLLERNAAIQEAAAKIAEIRGRATPLYQARLRERLGELLAGSNIDPQRLAQEAAILADRSDIGEEITRLGIHATQLTKLLNEGAEVGKKLDFLLQEMNRETNTILSKSNGIGELGLTITELALGVKSEVERIREQSLNLE